MTPTFTESLKEDDSARRDDVCKQLHVVVAGEGHTRRSAAASAAWDVPRGVGHADAWGGLSHPLLLFLWSPLLKHAVCHRLSP